MFDQIEVGHVVLAVFVVLFGGHVALQYRVMRRQRMSSRRRSR